MPPRGVAEGHGLDCAGSGQYVLSGQKPVEAEPGGQYTAPFRLPPSLFCWHWMGESVPAGQNEPAGHCFGVAVPAGQNEPAGQPKATASGRAIPALGQNVLAGHGDGFAEPAEHVLPAGHGTAEPAPGGQYAPAGHVDILPSLSPGHT